MLEKLQFHTLLLPAWQASFSKKLPWFFASLLAIASIIGSRLGATLPEVSSFQEFFNILSDKAPETLLLFFCIFIFLFSLEIFGKSNLIVSLSFVTGKTSLPNHPNNIAAVGKNFVRVFLLECLVILFLLAVAGIFSLPFLIASSQNPGVLDALLELGFLAFIPIYIAVFLVKQFALFYFLLSPLTLRGALETGASLLSRFIFPSLLFSLFSLALTIIFTFGVNTLVFGVTTLSEKIGFSLQETPIAIFTGLLSFAWFSIFQQALWLAFFKSIAGQSEPVEPIKEEATFDNQTVPEIPPAQ